MLSVAVAYSSKNGNAKRLAAAISEGCQLAGNGAQSFDLGKPLHEQALAAFDLVFLGFDIPFYSADPRAAALAKSGALSGKKTALFCSYSFSKKPLWEVAGFVTHKGGIVVNSLALKAKCASRLLGGGNLGEVDLPRASAFAERTINNLLNRRVVKDSRKSEIGNYLKPR